MLEPSKNLLKNISVLKTSSKIIKFMEEELNGGLNDRHNLHEKEINDSPKTIQCFENLKVLENFLLIDMVKFLIEKIKTSEFKK